MSKAKIKSAPNKKPVAAGITLINPSPSDISIDGASKDQKLAATITPPVNPSIPSNRRLCIVLKKTTREAPAIVISQVNKVAIDSNQDTNESNILL